MNYIYTPSVLQCMHFQHNDIAGSPIRTVMDYELDFCVGCDREMQLDDKCYSIKKGCFVVRKPGQKVSSRGKYDCYMLTLDFSNNTAVSNYSRNTATQKQRPFESEIWNILPSVFQPAHYDDYVRIFRALLSVNEVDINKNINTLSLINELLHLIVSDAFSQYYLPVGDEKPVDQICDYMKNNFMNKITLEDLSKIVHLNKNYLVRQFKSEFGISPISYLINIRMNYAKKLLLESNLPIKSIAVYCGYKDPSFFNYYFKKSFNVSPELFRRYNRTE